eukprot:m.275822 g.275822  ORF g.275822 m.275822 type:complete len:488 (+) comp16295_c0_seq6:119-1582(+)
MSVNQDGIPRGMADKPTEDPKKHSSIGVLLNFSFMSLCFSLNHGCVTALIAVASSVIKPESLSGQSVGALYVCYTLSSMLFANAAVDRFGPKWTLFIGLLSYCAYVGSFLIAAYSSGLALKLFVIGGGVIGGLGAGVLWTAQGKFFSASAQKYATARGISTEAATAFLASIFTTFYLGLEVVLKIMLSTIDTDKNEILLFVIFTAVAVGSTVGMMFVQRVVKESKHISCGKMTEKLGSAIKLMLDDPKVLLMAPYNFTFGFAAPFLNQYVNAFITKDRLGRCLESVNSTAYVGFDQFGNSSAVECRPGCLKCSGEYIGWMSASVVGVGFITSIVFGYLNRHNVFPKAVPMIFGSLCFGALSLIFVILDESSASHWSLVIPVYIMFGVGRGVWESTTKAVFADFFPGALATAGFANIALQNGLSGALGYFIFPFFSYHIKAYFVIGFAGLGILTYLLAQGIHTRSKLRQERTSVESKPLMDNGEEFEG